MHLGDTIWISAFKDYLILGTVLAYRMGHWKMVKLDVPSGAIIKVTWDDIYEDSKDIQATD